MGLSLVGEKNTQAATMVQLPRSSDAEYTRVPEHVREAYEYYSSCTLHNWCLLKRNLYARVRQERVAG